MLDHQIKCLLNAVNQVVQRDGWRTGRTSCYYSCLKGYLKCDPIMLDWKLHKNRSSGRKHLQNMLTCISLFWSGWREWTAVSVLFKDLETDVRGSQEQTKRNSHSICVIQNCSNLWLIMDVALPSSSTSPPGWWPPCFPWFLVKIEVSIDELLIPILSSRISPSIIVITLKMCACYLCP